MNITNNNWVFKCVEFLKEIEKNNYTWIINCDHNDTSARLSCISLFLKLARIFENYNRFSMAKSQNELNKFKIYNNYFDDKPNKNDFLIAETRQALSGLINTKGKYKIPDLDINYPDQESLYFFTDSKWNNPWDAGAQLSHYLFYCHYLNRTDLIESALHKLKKYEKEDGWYNKRPNDTVRINGIMKIFTGLDVINYDYFSIQSIVKTIINSIIKHEPKSGGFNIYDYVYVLSKGIKINYRNKECDTKLREIYNRILTYQQSDGGFSYSREHSQKKIYLRNIPNSPNVGDIHGTTLYCMAMWIIDKSCNLNLNLNTIIS